MEPIAVPEAALAGRPECQLVHYAYYRPSEAEIEHLRNGGFLELAQYGSGVQPFGLVVWPPWDGEQVAAAARKAGAAPDLGPES
jgi:hypothetical protein